VWWSQPGLVPRLFAFNLLLQVFDLIATYVGVHAGVPEANPLIRTAFAYVGVGPALLLFKLKACGLLLLLNYIPRRRLVAGAFGFLAIIYLAVSVVPWTVTFLLMGHVQAVLQGAHGVSF
jgi:hypothetical protein